MLIPPKYRLTKEIIRLLSSIEASKEVINSIEIPPIIENNIRRESTLKSSLYSARIEGNTMTLEEIELNPKEKKKMEVFNILTALSYIKEKKLNKLTTSNILKLHSITMKGLSDRENTGKFRKNHEAIFNSAGIAIYLPPPPQDVENRIKELIEYVNSNKEKLIPVKAVLSHYVFEKIHPFLDGSGRVGRLIMQEVLYMGDYGMKQIVPLEEYLDNHRSEYYRMLEEPEKDATDYVTFMLKAIAETADTAKQFVLSKNSFSIEDTLLPRRAEIFRIIKEQKMVNFDQIKRRFSLVNNRTLRYDIKKLVDAKLIIKLGTTRGVYYRIR